MLRKKFVGQYKGRKTVGLFLTKRFRCLEKHSIFILLE